MAKLMAMKDRSWGEVQLSQGPINEDLFEKSMTEYLKKHDMKPTVEHKCHNCGATLTMNNDKHIFMCKYCGSVYAIGTRMINDRG